MKKIFFYTIVVLLNAAPLFSGLDAQNSDNPISLPLEKSQNKNYISNFLFNNPVKIWGQKEKLITDSILYGFSVIDKKVYESIPQATGLPTALNILVEEKAGMRIISLLKRYNSFLDKEWTVSYKSDSLKQNFENKEFYQSIPFVEVMFPVYRNNKVEMEAMEFCFFPYEKGVTYNDPMIGNLPLIVSSTKKREASYLDCRLSYRQDAGFNSPIEVFASENNNYHVDKYENGFKYKFTYNIHDTVYLHGSYYRLEGVSPDWKEAYILPVDEPVVKDIYLPEAIFAKVKPNLLGDKEYTVLDFWGTWCAPCIAKLPDMKDLYAQVHSEYGFLGICNDSRDNFEKAKEIYSKNQIPWSQIFDNQGDIQSISSNLRVTFFPTYMVIDNKTGRIIYGNEGNEGFEGLKELVLKQ